MVKISQTLLLGSERGKCKFCSVTEAEDGFASVPSEVLSLRR